MRFKIPIFFILTFYILQINGQDYGEGGGINDIDGRQGPDPEIKPIDLENWTPLGTTNPVSITKITLGDERTADFHGVTYNGLGMYAYFVTGKVEEGQDYTKEAVILKTAIRLANEHGRCNRPRNYNNHDFTLKLPKGKKWTDFQFILFYNIKDNMSFGFVEFPENIQLPPSPDKTEVQECGTTNHFRICIKNSTKCPDPGKPRIIENWDHPGKGKEDKKITSVKVTLIDEITIEFVNLFFSDVNTEAHFVVGKSENFIHEKGLNITADARLAHKKGCLPYEPCFEKIFRLTLPAGKTWRDYHVLVLLNIIPNINLGYIEIPKDIKLPNATGLHKMSCGNIDNYKKCHKGLKTCFNTPECPTCPCQITNPPTRICVCNNVDYDNECFFKCAKFCNPSIKPKFCAGCKEEPQRNQTECRRWLESINIE